MDILHNSTRIPLQELSNLPLISPQLSVLAVCTISLATAYFFSTQDPYNLKQIATVRRWGLLDAYNSGVWWRLFVPRLLPYTEAGYYKYNKNGKPFKIWINSFQAWAYVLPTKHMARIKNEGTSTLSFESVVNKFLSPRFSSGNVDTFEIQVASKLMNGNLTTIKPMVQVRTDSFLDREIGSPKEWKRINAHHLTMKAMRYISGRVVFGEALADNAAFIKALEQYVSNAVPYALALRYFNLGPLRDTIMNLLHWRHRKDLAIATQFVTDLIIERRRIQRDQNLSDDELPVDCIQWAMDQDMPEDMKQPEKIAHRILHLCAGIIDTPGSGMINLLYDVASHGECLDELRAEIRQCLAEDGGGWTQNAMAKMKKFDSFIQECFRISPGVTPLTGWRVVTSDTFRFDEDLVLPKGVLLTFPSIHLQNDPDIHPDPTKFDPLRFYRMKEEDRKAGVTSSSRDLRTEWLAFGYGRQACPGRFYAIRLLTTVLGEMILRYDIRYAGGRRARPEPIDLEPLLGPDQSIEIEFRARA